MLFGVLKTARAGNRTIFGHVFITRQNPMRLETCAFWSAKDRYSGKSYDIWARLHNSMTICAHRCNGTAIEVHGKKCL